MAEHFCKEHQTVWFKKGGMKGYAHPLLDENGEPTGGWCNEPKEEKAPKPQTKDDMSKEDWADKDRITRASIEQQVAVKAIIDLIVAGKLDIHGTQGLTTMNWAMSKLSNWSSMGEPNPSEPSEASLATSTQIKNLTVARKGKEYPDELLLAVMIKAYKKSSIKELTGTEITDLTKKVEEGYQLNKTEPEDIPF